jgi:hypothetical protein
MNKIPIIVSVFFLGFITTSTVVTVSKLSRKKQGPKENPTEVSEKKKEEETTTEFVSTEPIKVDVVFLPNFIQEKNGILTVYEDVLYNATTEDIQNLINEIFINTYIRVRDHANQLLYLPFLPGHEEVIKTFVQKYLVSNQNDISDMNSLINIFITNFLTKTYEMNANSISYKIYYNILFIYILLELNNNNVENLSLLPVMTKMMEYDLNISSKNKQKLSSYSTVIFFSIAYIILQICYNRQDIFLPAMIIIQFTIFSIIVMITSKTTIEYTKTFNLIQSSNLSDVNKQRLESILSKIHTSYLPIQYFQTSNSFMILSCFVLIVYVVVNKSQQTEHKL